VRISFGDVALGPDPLVVARWRRFNDVSETYIANAPSFVTLSSS
jgi:hypothetical protein